MQSAQTFRWDEMAVDHPLEKIDRRRVVGEQVMLSHVTLHKGFSVASHAHENEQLAVVLSGRVKFTLGDGTEHVVAGGGVLWLPSNVPHAAEAIETSVVLDVFSPPSEKTGVDRD